VTDLTFLEIWHVKGLSTDAFEPFGQISLFKVIYIQNLIEIPKKLRRVHQNRTVPTRAQVQESDRFLALIVHIARAEDEIDGFSKS
jgi:hypothetical protein